MRFVFYCTILAPGHRQNVWLDQDIDYFIYLLIYLLSLLIRGLMYQAFDNVIYFFFHNKEFYGVLQN